MAIFRRKKIEGKKEGEKKEEDVKEEKTSLKAEENQSEKIETLARESVLAWKILKGPHITEKATNSVNSNQYIFKVFPGAHKTEIKKAIEDLFNIDVLAVKIIKVPPRKRRVGRIEGWRKGYKKAIIKIKSGQKIDVLPR